MGKLSGKKALVVGGSRGIGAATALALAEEGADVAISYASPSPERADLVVAQIESKGVRAAAFRADQAVEEQAVTLVGEASEKLGGLDILVANAALSTVIPIDSEDADPALFERQMAINYTSVVAMIRAAYPLMPAGGRIISVTSGAAHRVGFPGMADYAGTKAALEAYSRGAARDLARREITVNILQPGFVDTETNPADGPAADIFLPTTALGRYGRPEEIAAGAVFLASPQASYVTGAVLRIDGGYSA